MTRAIIGTEEVVVGDLMLCEVLQGLDDERTAREVEGLMRRFEIVHMAGDAIAVAAARNFRSLRRRGITVRKTIDLLIGTWCIENRRPLLHNNSDFHPMARYLGLIEVPITA
jgi:predicted nucleic acid-binding protein